MLPGLCYGLQATKYSLLLYSVLFIEYLAQSQYSKILVSRIEYRDTRIEYLPSVLGSAQI